MRGNMQINKFSDISLERVSKLKVCQSADQLKFGIVHRIIIVGLMNLFGVCENVSHLYSMQVILLFYCRGSGMLYPLTRTTALYLYKQTQLVSFQNQQSICILQPPKMLYIQCNCDAIGVEWRESVTNVRWPLTGLLDHYFISADLLLLLYYYWNPRGYWERWFRFDWSPKDRITEEDWGCLWRIELDRYLSSSNILIIHEIHCSSVTVSHGSIHMVLLFAAKLANSFPPICTLTLLANLHSYPPTHSLTWPTWIM